MNSFTPPVTRRPPVTGSRVKVWFDKHEQKLLIETEQGERTYDTYGVYLGDTIFDTETTPRGAVRCFAIGVVLAVAGTNEGHEIERKTPPELKDYLDFYWWRDKAWPVKRARLALIAKPQGGVPTCFAVDPVWTSEEHRDRAI